MRVLITGATGLVGTELVSILNKNGIDVNYLSTSKGKLETKEHLKGFYWNPSKGFVNKSALEDVDAIIHLAGASIAKRWTKQYKKEIYDSRIASAALLFQTLQNNPHQVKQVISASAIGIYRDSPDTIFTEESNDFDNGFLGDVVNKWEDEIDKFKSLGIKTCKLRTGLVLAGKGGALPEMLRPIKFGVGAAFGSGKQMQSWIHITDLSEMYHFVLSNSLEGIFNAVAPNPVSNQQLTKAIASGLHRTLLLPNIPKFAMQLILGEMHQLLFSSQNVSAEKIIKAGFTFKHPHLEEALENILQ